MTRVISAGSTKGRAASWISTAVRRVGGKRLEPGADGVLPLARRQQPAAASREEKLVRGGLVEPDIVWMDHHDYVVHARMRGKGCRSPGSIIGTPPTGKYCFGISDLGPAALTPRPAATIKARNAHG